MRETKSETPPVYGVISLAYDKVILPLVDATRLMDCFAKAERFDTGWKDNKSEVYIGGKLPSISLELLSGADWLAGKLSGAKE